MLLIATLLLSSGSPAALPIPARSLEAEPLMRALPEDTLGFVSVWDIDDFRSTFEASTYAALLKHPKMQPLMRYVRDESEYDDWELGDEFEMHPIEAWNAIQGSLVGFVRATPTGGDEPDFSGGFLIENPAGSPDFEALLEKFTAMLSTEVEAPPVAQAYGRATLRSWIPTQGNGGGVVLARVDDLTAFLFAKSGAEAQSLAQYVVDRYSGSDDQPGFSSNLALRSARSQPSAGGTFEGFLDLATLIGLVGVPEDREAAELMDLFGVADLRALYASAELGAGEHFDSVLSLEVAQSGGFFTKVQSLFGPAPLELLGKMPKNASQVQLLNFDVNGLYSLVMSTVQTYNPEWFNMAKGGLQMAGGMVGMDFENDLFPQFTGHFGGFTAPLSEAVAEELKRGAMANEDLALFNAMSLSSGGSVGYIGLNDGEDLALWIEDLLAMGDLDEDLMSRQVHGSTLYSVSVEDAFQAHWAFTADALLYTIGVDEPIVTALAIAERGPGPSAKDNPRFQNEMRAHAGSSLVMLADSRATLRTAISAFQNLSSLASISGDADAEELAEIPLPDESVAELFKSTIVESFRASGGRFQLRVNVR